MQSPQISAFGSILLFLLFGTGFVVGTVFLSKLISPSKPNPEKLTSYECGEEPTGNAWVQFNMRFYVIALIFLLFDAELIFLFPWATVFGNKELIAAAPAWGWLSFGEMCLFLLVLLVGLVYVWRKGDLDWVKPQPLIPAVDTKIPFGLYQQLNESPYERRAFVVEQLNVSEQAPAESKSISPRRALYQQAMADKVKQEEEEEQAIEKANQPVSPPARPAYQPKFKSKTAEPTETMVPAEAPKEESAKPIYKPRLKPGIIVKTEEKPNEPLRESQPETDNAVKSIKTVYKPRFKPTMAKTSEEKLQEQSIESPIETAAEEPVKTAYKPRFKPEITKPPEEKPEEKSPESSPEKPDESIKQAYKPRFRPGIGKNEEE